VGKVSSTEVSLMSLTKETFIAILVSHE